MKKIAILGLSAVAIAAFAAPVWSATITNNDTEARTVIITEGGNQQELSLGAGESASFCPQGCFVSLQGERETLLGSEAVEINSGRLRVR